jgi:hypothetical protein
MANGIYLDEEKNLPKAIKYKDYQFPQVNLIL